MDILKIVLYIIFVIDCIALSAIILLQEGKSADWEQLAVWRILIWGQNKGTFYGRCTCKVYKVSCYPFSWCLQ